MEVKLLPYTYVDGQITIKDSQMKLLYKMARDEGTLEVIFSDVDTDMMTEDDFVQMYKFGSCRMWVVMCDGKLCGWLWVDDIHAGRARVHYNFLRWAIKEKLTRDIAKECIRQLLDIRDDLNRRVFITLVGETPITNKLAVRFLKSIGMTVLGILPSAQVNHKLGEMVDVVVSYVTREE